MAKYSIEDTTLTAIADKLREKTGNIEKITTVEMPDKIDEVFAAGEESEWERFWDVYQENGRKQSYPYGFYNWKTGAYNPKYDIVFGENGSASYTFAYGRMETIPGRLVAQPKAGSTVTLSNTFTSSSIKTINKLVLSSEIKFNHAFDYCPMLERISVEGTIGQNGFDIHSSTLLTHDSLMTIINALADYSVDTSGTVWTVTLGDENLAKLTEEEIGIAEAKGWVLA